MIKKETYRKGHYCCEDWSLIENYDKAIADTTQTWSIHHRLETHTSDGEIRTTPITRDELIAMNMYYNRPASELIFLTPTNHTALHDKFLIFTEETKEKMSIAQKARKGKKQYMQTEEYKKAVSEAKKNAHVITPGNTGMKCYNNGIKNTYAFECPEGFVEGRLPYKQRQKRKPLSEETRKKISEGNKGKHISEETKKKLSLNGKGRKWFNNGIISVMRFECPEGFVKGRLSKEEKENVN